MNALRWLINLLVILYVAMSSSPEVNGEALAAPEADPMPFRARFGRIGTRTRPRSGPRAGSSPTGKGPSAPKSNIELPKAPTAKKPLKDVPHTQELENHKPGSTFESAHGNAQDLAQNLAESIAQTAEEVPVEETAQVG